MIKISAIALMICLMSSQVNSVNHLTDDVVQDEYFLLNKQVPHFTGYNLDGSSVDETILKDKVILLNFMFIGCRGCMQELPDLAKLEQSGFKDL